MYVYYLNESLKKKKKIVQQNGYIGCICTALLQQSWWYQGQFAQWLAPRVLSRAL